MSVLDPCVNFIVQSQGTSLRKLLDFPFRIPHLVLDPSGHWLVT